MSGGGSCPFRAYSTNAKIIPSLTTPLILPLNLVGVLYYYMEGLNTSMSILGSFYCLVFSILPFALITALYRFFVPLTNLLKLR